ncbi:MAG: hypothetical protein HPY44_16710 [Armatimonadetes bacterium]|nr:hypothetical protein [Armatimonadota bacterium]
MKSPPTTNILAVDGGGTGTRCVVAASDGTVLGAGEAGPSNYRRVGIETAVGNVRRAAEAALQAAGMKPPVDRACYCLAGAGLPDGRAPFLEALHGLHLARSVSLYSDARAAWAGAHLLEPGVVLIAGTGAVAFGVDAEGREALADGWGPLWGDEGGAYWIGLQSLRAVARADDGRGPATSLTHALLVHFAAGEPREIISRLPLDRTHSREIAALASICSIEAERGDEPARRILEEAGELLAITAAAPVASLGLGPAPNIAVMGGVLSSQIVRGSLVARLRGRFKGAAIGDPALPAVLGAVLLGLQAAGVSPSPETHQRLGAFVGRSTANNCFRHP